MAKPYVLRLLDGNFECLVKRYEQPTDVYEALLNSDLGDWPTSRGKTVEISYEEGEH